MGTGPIAGGRTHPDDTRAAQSHRIGRRPRRVARLFCAARIETDATATKESVMIVVMEPGASREAVEVVEGRIRAAGLDVHVSRGVERTLVGAIGDERVLDPGRFESMPGVERAMRVVEPYRLVSREWHPGHTVVDVGGAAIGGREVQVIAGPLGRDRRADGRGGRRGRARWRAADARGRVQAAHEPVCVPGDGNRGPAHAERAAARGMDCRSSPSSWTLRMLDEVPPKAST